MKKQYMVIGGALFIAALVLGYWFGTRTGDRDGYPTQGEPQTYAHNQPVDYNELLRDYEARLAKNPNDWDTNARMGDIYFGMKRFNEAMVYYRKAVELNPSDADSYNDMGLSNLYLNNPVEGLRYVEEGIKVDPYYQRIWLTKGFILAYGLGKKKEAEEAWNKVISINPDNTIGKDARSFIESLKDEPSGRASK